MGFEAERFVSDVDDEFICSICLSVFDEPVNGPCGHAFCAKCINHWIPLNVNTCPLDKKPLFRKDLVAACLPFRNLLNRLELKCDFQGVGCDHVTSLSQMSDHVRICPFNPEAEMVCDQGCGLKFLRKAEGEHRCIDALKELLGKKDAEIADLKRKGIKRPLDGPFARSLDAQLGIPRYYATRTRNLLHMAPSSSSADRYNRSDRSSFMDRLDSENLSGQPSTSASNSDQDLGQISSPIDDMRTVRVMLRRLTDEQLRTRHIPDRLRSSSSYNRSTNTEGDSPELEYHQMM